MPFIKVALDDIKEGDVVPEGEYDLRIVKAESGKSKKGNSQTTVTIAIEDRDYPNAFPVRHWLREPAADEDRKSAFLATLELKRFLECFNIPYNDDGFDTDDLVGAEGRCFLSQEEADDGNVYNRLKLPRLRG